MLDLLAHREKLDHKDRRANQVCQAMMVLQVCQVTQDHKVQLVTQVLLALLVLMLYGIS
jgi:uncharacterized membrane protein